MFQKISINRLASIKTLTVRIGDDEDIIVQAPLGVSDAFCHSFVYKHRRRLRAMMGEKKRRLAAEKILQNSFFYLGNICTLQIDTTLTGRYVFDTAQLIVRDETCFHHFLVDEAKRIIRPKIAEIASFYDVSYREVRFKDMTSRWGSCSIRGNLNFNIRLIGAPKSVIEYVVIHEVCHLGQLNHLKAFWESVERLAPYRKESEEWLRMNGHLLLKNRKMSK